MEYKKLLDKLIERYNLDYPVYYQEDWEQIIPLKEFELKHDDNIDITYHNNDIIEENEDDVWNGVVRRPREFNVQERYIKSINSDYYSYISINNELLDNVNDYRRDFLVNTGNIKFSHSLGVLNCIILEKEDNLQVVYHKRSDNVGINSNRGVDDNHSSLLECTEDEFAEELFNDNTELIDNLDFSVYYTGACLPITMCNFHITSLIHINGEDVNRFLDNIEKSPESEEIYIEDLDVVKSNIGDEINIYNSTLGGYYCLNRTIDVADSICD
jgi:hypothetical protein